jgi:hypothetical protein
MAKTTKKAAVELVTGEIPALLSSWRYTRELRETEPDLAADDAVDILAAWAHLQRFSPEDIPEDIWDRISDVISRDGALMASLIGEVLDPSGWMEAAKKLEEATNEVLCDVPAIDETALELFRQLDTAELAVWAAQKLGCDQSRELIYGLAECVNLFLEKLDIFVPAGDYARVMHAAYRSDLMGFNGDLFLTTEKFPLLIDEDYLVPFGEEEVTPITEEQYRRLCESFLSERESSQEDSG